MPSRNRHSTVKPVTSRLSVVTANPTQPARDVLPLYKKPSHPLDADATRLLRELQGRNLNDTKRHNVQAAATIISTAESVNDMLREHAQYVERRQKKWDTGKGLADKEEDEQTMKELQQKVEDATAKLEESMRAVIDSGVAVQRMDETLDWLRQNAPKQLEEEYQTQMTQRATQRHSQSQVESQHQLAEDHDEESLEDALTPGPTPLDGSRVALTGASELFTARMQRQKDTYTSLSLIARYARNNNYRDFKRIVHDAKFGDSGPTLGHEDTWFTETGSPAPGITDSTQRGDFDDDDDIVVDKATISTRCPITFQQFKEPYTSTKCPHTFEKNAILDMIRSSTMRVGGSGRLGAPGIACPVTGCAQILTAADLRADPILIRKIKRMQQAEAEEAEESSDEEEIQAPQWKPQRLDGSFVSSQLSNRLRVSASQQPPTSSIVEDLGTPSESDTDM
ncbi:zinc-finger of the MIZ type in Nse subunit-domain-containing protein [Pyrenochaeta sp. MPI-SDFR-AT-0127]|nr:zinc-finger of the MIZ type in Nse subunit-domain-containing protein [Pyrenochaeta sp. MPI-SDFR-AT-0127]